MKQGPRISQAEWEVMKAVWKQSTSTAQEVIDSLSPAAGWTPATIKTLLNRLVRKGALRFEKQGKAYLYSAVFSEKQCQAAEAESFLERIFDGSLSPMIAHFAQSRRLTQKDLAELEQLLKQRKKTK